MLFEYRSHISNKFSQTDILTVLSSAFSIVPITHPRKCVLELPCALWYGLRVISYTNHVEKLQKSELVIAYLSWATSFRKIVGLLRNGPFLYSPTIWSKKQRKGGCAPAHKTTVEAIARRNDPILRVRINNKGGGSPQRKVSGLASAAICS